MAWSCGSPSHVKGVDVSSAQGVYPASPQWWRTLNREYHIQFGIIKASEGIAYVNPYLQSAWNACTQVNGERATGLYHFLDWQYPGTQQAEHFWQVVQSLDHPPYNAHNSILVLDVEEPNGTSSTATPSVEIVNDFIQALSNRLAGFQENLVIYTNYDTWAKLLNNPTHWSSLALWLGAMDGESCCPPQEFGGWVNWSYMQYGLANLGGMYADLNQLNL